MKIPLCYQRTEYDCGPTSVLNAINYLFNREELPPELLRAVVGSTLDVYGNTGEYGRRGTSQLAMRYVGAWLNGFSSVKGFPLYTEYISGGNVSFLPGSSLCIALANDGVAVIRLMHGGSEHYLLATGISGDMADIFDPYYEPELLFDSPWCNHSVPLNVLRKEGMDTYNMLPAEKRDALLFFVRRGER